VNDIFIDLSQNELAKLFKLGKLHRLVIVLWRCGDSNPGPKWKPINLLHT